MKELIDFHHTKAAQRSHDEACKPMKVTSDDDSLTIAYLCGYNDAKRSIIPDGWRLVPKEPTKEMLKAGRHINSESVLPIKSVYQAMLSAAPKFGEEK